MKSTLLKIAKEVRAWAENLYAHRKLLGEKDWYNDLGGMCAICSVELADRLKKNSFSPSVVKNDIHTYVVCSGYLLDITATQFGKQKKVVIKKHRRMPEELYWEVVDICTYTTFDEAQKMFERWPDSQQPARFESQFV